MSYRIDLDFRGDRSGAGPATWSQREQWATLEANPSFPTRFTMRRTFELHDGVTLDPVLAALQTVVERYESLRTMFRTDEQGILVQFFSRTGRMSIIIQEHAKRVGNAEANALANELAELPFDHAIELPVRFGVILSDGEPMWVCCAISHLATDLAALGILSRELNTLLGSAGDQKVAPISRQPLEQAAYEQSAAGQRVQDTAIQYWRSGLKSAPRMLFRTPTGDFSEPRYPHAILYAKGLGTTMQRIADELDVGASAVYIAAAIKSLADASRVCRFGLTLTLSNRSDPGAQDYVGTIAQQGLIRVEGLGSSFYALARRAWPALLRAHRTARFDPALLDALFDELDDGAGPTVDHYVNLIALATPLKFPGDPVSTPDGDQVYRLLDPVPSTALRFGLKLYSGGPDAMMRMFVDQRYVTRDTMRTVMEDISALLRQASLGDVAW
jgi:Condensation domain